MFSKNFKVYYKTTTLMRFLKCLTFDTEINFTIKRNRIKTVENVVLNMCADEFKCFQMDICFCLQNTFAIEKKKEIDI